MALADSFGGRTASPVGSRIFLDKVRLYAFHGVAEQERQVGGWFTVSVSVEYDYGKAMATDSVDDTVSYADLLEVVKREMAQPSRLLEHVAGRIAQAIVDVFPAVETVWISVTKENPPMGANCEGAGVELEVRSDG